MNRHALLIFVCLAVVPASLHPQKAFRLGIDVFVRDGYQAYLGKKVGLITNATGMSSERVSSVDAIHRLGDPELVKLFGPEHGIRGDAYGGDRVVDRRDPRTGLPVISLYGRQRKPTGEMLRDIDVLFYDIQDVGNRTYTYISTMAYAMQAAAENNVAFVVLDRPIPMFGHLVDGNVLDPAFSSFIGLYPLPYVYGMTPGELAHFINGEFRIDANLNVIKMEGYDHGMEFEDTGLLWIPTSPHIPKWETAYHYAATGCMGELHTVCVGVGYTLPFELVGAEWIDGHILADDLNSRNLPGVYFHPTFFKPFYSVFKDRACSGVQLILTDRKKFLPFTTQIHILEAIQARFPQSRFLDSREKRQRISSFHKASGTDQIRMDILAGKSAEEIFQGFQEELRRFKEKRRRYLLYE